MKKFIGSVTYLVRNYDEAIDFFINKLQFNLVADIPLNEKKRWVLVAPKGSSETNLLLAEADGDEQSKSIGNQTGGRVAFFLHTDDFDRDHSVMLSKGIVFLEEPRNEEYGKVAVFEDLYGNKWDMIEPRT